MAVKLYIIMAEGCSQCGDYSVLTTESKTEAETELVYLNAQRDPECSSRYRIVEVG